MSQTNDSHALNLVLLIQGFLLTSTKKYKKHGPLNLQLYKYKVNITWVYLNVYWERHFLLFIKTLRD